MEGSENVGEANSTEWRSQLQSEARQRVVNKMMVTLRKHLPNSGNEGLGELRNIAVRFEENIYNDATSQSDYLRKISMKMLIMERNARGGGVNGNSLSSNSGAVNQSSDPEFFEIPSSAQSQRSPPKQGEAPSVGVASREVQQKRSPLVLQVNCRGGRERATSIRGQLSKALVPQSPLIVLPRRHSSRPITPVIIQFTMATRLHTSLILKRAWLR